MLTECQLGSPSPERQFYWVKTQTSLFHEIRNVESYNSMSVCIIGFSFNIILVLQMTFYCVSLFYSLFHEVPDSRNYGWGNIFLSSKTDSFLYFLWEAISFSPPRCDSPERKLNSGTMKRRVWRPLDSCVCVGVLRRAGVWRMAAVRAWCCRSPPVCLSCFKLLRDRE